VRYAYKKAGLTTEGKIGRLTGIVGTLAASVVAHDGRIEPLISMAEQQGGRIQALITAAEKHERAIEDISKQWQVWLNTLPRH
jgi:hypothetical protein